MFRLRREAAIFVERDVTDKDRRHATNAGVVYNRVYAGNEQTVGPVAADLEPVTKPSPELEPPLHRLRQCRKPDSSLSANPRNHRRRLRRIGLSRKVT